ncbi:MAG: thioredoxin domain-containing protein [Micrococcales bacterium]|nr:thioredoxin domain-containing protein [Micrococcales bacterium]MCL2668143.1 thioredoxin domain-containing protein [Micrococcales bacterium]
MATNDRLTKAQRRDEARRKAAELRARQEREQRRNKIIGIALLVLAVAVIVGAIAFLVKQRIDGDRSPVNLPEKVGTDIQVPSTGDAARGGIPVSKQGVGVLVADGVVVDVYLDFMCPHCASFEQTQGAEIDALLDPKTGRDDVTIVYHVVSILDGASLGNNYSTRAANAVSVVADKDPDHFVAFMNALFASQPKENTPGHGDKRLAEIAQSVGVPATVTNQFTATASYNGKTLRTFVPWTSAVTNTLPMVNGRGSTPTILVNGEDWMEWPAEPLSARVQAALGETPQDAPEETPETDQ